MQQERAEIIAAQVLAWLAGQEELMPLFLGATGASADDLRAQAASAEFLGSVLDFVMMDDAWVMAFCDQAGLAYEVPMQARQSLPGGAQVHWT